MEIFKLFGSLALRGSDQVKKGVSDLGTSLNNVGSKITNVGAKLTLITAGFAALAVQGIKYNSTVQDLQTSFKVLLGSEEKAIKLTNDLKKVGAETPFEITGLAEASKTLLAFGITNEKLIPTMTKLGDISLGNNEAFQSMSRVMGQINALGKLQGGDLNQLINWGWNPLNEITEKTGETMEQVRKRMSAGKVTYKEVEDALNKATSAGGRFYKGMEEGSRTLSGRISTLKDVFMELLGKATKPLFDFLAEKAIPFLTKLTEKVTQLDPNLSSLILLFIGLVSAAGPLTVVFGSIVAGLGAFLSAISVISLPIVVATGLITAFIGVIGGVGLAIVGLTIKSGKLEEVKEHFQKVIEVVTPIPSLISAIFTNDKDKMMDLLINKFNLSWQEADSFANKVNELKTKFDELAEKVGTKVKNKLVDLATNIYKNRHEIAEFIEKIIDFGIKLIEFTEKNGPAIKDFSIKIVKDMLEIVGVIGKIISGFEKAGELFSRYKYWSKQVKEDKSLLGTIKSAFALPKFASGTNYANGGLAIVGEKGPELLNIPTGTKIFSNNETKRILNSSNISNSNTNINNNKTIIEKVIINAKEIKELNDLIKMFSRDNILLEMNSN